jgi:hypothetical protein
MPAHLHRHRRKGRQRLASLVLEARHVANGENLRVTRYRQILIYDYPTSSIRFRTQTFGQRRSGVSRRPNYGPTRNKFFSDLYSFLGHIFDQRTGSNLDIHALELFQGGTGKVFAEPWQHARSSFYQQNTGLTRIDATKIFC